MGGAIKRYFAVVGMILAVIVALGLWLKPSPEEMREQVEMGLAQYARPHTETDQVAPAAVIRQSGDWIIFRSYRAVASDKAFFCIGGFNVTFCSLPD